MSETVIPLVEETPAEEKKEEELKTEEKAV